MKRVIGGPETPKIDDVIPKYPSTRCKTIHFNILRHSPHKQPEKRRGSLFREAPTVLPVTLQMGGCCSEVVVVFVLVFDIVVVLIFDIVIVLIVLVFDIIDVLIIKIVSVFIILKPGVC